MVASLIICGSGSLPRDDDDDHGRSIQSATSSPRKSSSSRNPSSTRRCKSHNNHHHHSKNPYATRGLDKFSSLLAEIEEKKRMIYSKNNPDEISFVQFDYSKNNNCKPIVIRVKPTKADQAEIKHHHHQPDLAAPAPAITDPLDNSKAVDHHHQDHHQKKISLLRRLKLQKLRKPSCYLPAILILILIFLVLFGRSVAILCTSIGWYAIPTISRRKPSSRRSLEKKRSMVVGHQGKG